MFDDMNSFDYPYKEIGVQIGIPWLLSGCWKIKHLET